MANQTFAKTATRLQVRLHGCSFESMALELMKIERDMQSKFGKLRAGTYKWLKNQRNRKIRRVPKDQVPVVKNVGWEF